MNVQVFIEDAVNPGEHGVAFSPMLYIPGGTRDVSFYEQAFGAKEIRRFINDDGSIHVSELTIGNAIFHLHEPTAETGARDPSAGGYTTVFIGLFVDDVHAVMVQAEAAGARVTSAVQDYEYGYRQGGLIDPFGHQWEIQKMIGRPPGESRH